MVDVASKAGYKRVILLQKRTLDLLYEVLTLDDETPTEVVESRKIVAVDGTLRGLKRKGSKNRRTQLIEECQAAVERDTGMKNWDPVVMLAVISARAFSGYGATDENGNPILDTETGRQVMIPPNPELAAAVAAKAAPYLHQHLRPKEVDGEGDDEKDPGEVKERVLQAFENMGVKVNRDDEDPT